MVMRSVGKDTKRGDEEWLEGKLRRELMRLEEDGAALFLSSAEDECPAIGCPA
jgi:hypothetical protein